MSRQHDAHVRCRAKLIRRIIRRFRDKCAARHRPTAEVQNTAIVAALAAYDWAEGWDCKWVGRYSAYPQPGAMPSRRKVQAKAIPIATVDAIVLDAWRRMKGA